MALTMRERAFRPVLIAAVLAEPRPGVVLDLGCGTGTLDVAWLKEALRDRQHPDAARPTVALASFLAGFWRGRGYDYWDRSDPRPAALMAANVARSLPRRIVRALRRGTPAEPTP